MLIRKTQGLSILKKYLFSGAVAVFCMATAVLALREMLIPKTVASCDLRYTKAGVFSWQRGNGRMLSALDLQAKLNGRDWGLIENARFVKTKDVPLGAAMVIGLPRENSKARNRRMPSGVGFVWSPRWLKPATAACLGYSLRLPKNFKFGSGGSLPGLFGGGGDAADEVNARKSKTFSVQMHWRENKRLGLRLKSTEYPGGISLDIDKNYLKLDVGRWIRVDQEIVLNTPGRANGVLRVWVDGKLRLDLKNLNYRAKPGEGLRGVVANIHYANKDLRWAASPQNTALALSSFFVRWK